MDGAPTEGEEKGSKAKEDQKKKAENQRDFGETGGGDGESVV